MKISFFIKVEMMLRFHTLKNFVSLFISVYSYVVLLLAIMFAIKVQCQFHPHAFYQSLMEIVPHLQRELVVLEGNLTSFDFISSFKACFTNLECFLCEYLQIDVTIDREYFKS